MFFDINDIYIGKIYDITGLDAKGTISDYYAAFVRIYDDKMAEYNYILINRGNINLKTIKLKHNMVFKEIEDIDVFLDEDIPIYYVSNLKPITKFILKENIRNFITEITIHIELSKINMEHSFDKVKIKK